MRFIDGLLLTSVRIGVLDPDFQRRETDLSWRQLSTTSNGHFNQPSAQGESRWKEERGCCYQRYARTLSDIADSESLPLPATKKLAKPAAAQAAVDAPKSDGDEDEEETSSASDDSQTAAPHSSKAPKARSSARAQSGGLRPSKSLEITLFDRLERMYGFDVKRMLTVQYRYVTSYRSTG